MQIERITLQSIAIRTFIGVVGCTGSGKSTLIRLLLRLFDVNKGYIEIDGQNIKNVTQNSLRKHLGIVPQDIALFNDSIKANVEYIV